MKTVVIHSQPCCLRYPLLRTSMFMVLLFFGFFQAAYAHDSVDIKKDMLFIEEKDQRGLPLDVECIFSEDMRRLARIHDLNLFHGFVERDSIIPHVRIRGVVYDSLTFEPLSFVIIKVPAFNHGIQADIEGFFELKFDRIPAGDTLVLEIESLTYEKKAVHVPVSSGHGTLRILMKQHELESGGDVPTPPRLKRKDEIWVEKISKRDIRKALRAQRRAERHKE